MLNILFVLYHDFTSNSAVHVFHWANELSLLGAACIVAVPDNPETLSALGEARFGAGSFSGLRRSLIFPDGRGPDVVHAWTPRENVREFCQWLRGRYTFRLFVHLEDNERHLLASALGQPWKAIARLPAAELDGLVPAHLSHPLRSEEFLNSADGATVIIDSLREFVPEHVPSMEIWPAADGAAFTAKPLNQWMRSKLGIPRGHVVFTYTGNVHFANAREVRSLYLAVAILNREGHRAVLIRTGRDFCPFLGPDDAWGRAHSIELGFVPRPELPDLLSAADILVQPGRPGPFNDYRFPSKLPEYLAAGRPVVLPKCNIGCCMEHGRDAWVMPKVDALDIVDAVPTIIKDRDLYQKLASGAREFFERRLSWTKGAESLLRFYQQPGTSAS